MPSNPACLTSSNPFSNPHSFGIMLSPMAFFIRRLIPGEGASYSQSALPATPSCGARTLRRAGTVLLWACPRVLGGPGVQGRVGLAHDALEHGAGGALECVSRGPAYAAAMGWGYPLGVGWEGRSVEGVAAGIVRVAYAHGNV